MTKLRTIAGSVVRHFVAAANKRAALTYLAVFLGCVSLAGCGWVYMADPVRAWVVDADDGHPLPGVHVVAWWRLKGGLEGGMGMGYVELMETTTDATGQFSFPGWGPRLVLKPGELRDETPTLLFFTPGYRLTGRENYNGVRRADVHMRSDWNDQKIPLQYYRGDLARYAEALSLVRTFTDDIIATDPCQLLEMPRMLFALSEQREAFVRAGINNGPDTLATLDQRIATRSCGSRAGRVREPK